MVLRPSSSSSRADVEARCGIAAAVLHSREFRFEAGRLGPPARMGRRFVRKEGYFTLIEPPVVTLILKLRRRLRTRLPRDSASPLLRNYSLAGVC